MALSSGRARAEERARGVAVAPDLGGKLRVGGEMRLVAQLLHELDREAAPVELAGEIEEERFESRRAADFHGRVDSEARHSLESASCCTETFYRKDARKRGLRAREADVGRREAERLSALGAVHHAAADRVRAAEQPPRGGEVGPQEGLAHARAGDALAFVGDGREDLDLEAQPASRGSEARGVARALRAIAEVVADEDPARAVAFAQ